MKRIRSESTVSSRVAKDCLARTCFRACDIIVVLPVWQKQLTRTYAMGGQSQQLFGAFSTAFGWIGMWEGQRVSLGSKGDSVIPIRCKGR